VLIVTLDYDSSTSSSPTVDGTTTGTAMDDVDVSNTGICVCCSAELPVVLLHQLALNVNLQGPAPLLSLQSAISGPVLLLSCRSLNSCR